MFDFLKNLNKQIYTLKITKLELEEVETKLDIKFSKIFYEFILNYNGFTYKSIEFLSLKHNNELSILELTLDIRKSLKNKNYIVIEYIGDGIYTLFNNSNGKIYSYEKYIPEVKEISSSLESYLKEKIKNA